MFKEQVGKLEVAAGPFFLRIGNKNNFKKLR
jgi:hypothetical protein